MRRRIIASLFHACFLSSLSLSVFCLALDVARQARNGAEAVKVLEKVRIVNGAKHGLNGEELPRTTISHLSQPQDFKAELKHDVRLSLAARSRSIPTKYHYDETGSVMFEEITQLPEYYLTRVETGILRERAGDIMKLVKPDELVELGSGSSTKTRLSDAPHWWEMVRPD